MVDKKERMRHFAKTIKDCGDWDPRYWGYFITFNESRFYEAHDILEDLWLECRRMPLDAFYKSLIQLAGAFVHLEKKRYRPAGALFKLCQGYLRPYGDSCEGLALGEIHDLIDCWADHTAFAQVDGPCLLECFEKPSLQMPGA